MELIAKLFGVFLQIGCFSIGGGYAVISLIQNQIVGKYGWLTEKTFGDIITISQMTPGPIAVNAATFVGTQVAGPLGAIVATIGCILPSCIFVTLLAFIYGKYKKMALLQGTLGSLRPAVVSMIAKAGLTIIISAFFLSGTITLTISNISFRMIAYFVVAIFLLRKVKLNPILVMLLCGAAEVVFTLIFL